MSSERPIPEPSGAEHGLWARARRKLSEGGAVRAAIGFAGRRAREVPRRVRHANATWPLDASRRLTRAFLAGFPELDDAHVSVGNYWLDSRLGLDASSVVYSFGVGGDVDFDLAAARAYGCRVHLYDPTPGSIAFMETVLTSGAEGTDRLTFHPFGAWNEDTELTFTVPDYGGSSSVVDSVHGGTRTFQAPCLRVRTMMDRNGHDHLDVLKMDIEGAAETVLRDVLASGIRPT
ncbi:MAG: FkbM family methyltransferase [Shimia sp.]